MPAKLASRMALTCLVLLPTLSPQTPRFALAIARFDGRLVPFAAYDGGGWERAWPEADETTDASAIDAVPSAWRRRGDRVPTVWRVWPASGRPPIQAKVVGLDVVEAHCARQVALKTNLPQATGEHPLKFGIAVDASSITVGAVSAVRQSERLWTAAAEVVLSGFAGLETAQAASSRDRLPQETPLPAARLTALYGEAKSAQSPLYFVAEKKYRTARFPQNASCGALTIITGWLVPTGAEYELRGAKVFLTDCDAKDARKALPLGVVRVSGQSFWILQEHGYEDEAYVIAEIGPSEVRYRLTVDGGGC